MTGGCGIYSVFYIKRCDLIVLKALEKSKDISLLLDSAFSRLNKLLFNTKRVSSMPL